MVLVVLHQFHHCVELQGLGKTVETVAMHDSDQAVHATFSVCVGVCVGVCVWGGGGVRDDSSVNIAPFPGSLQLWRVSFPELIVERLIPSPSLFVNVILTEDSRF